MVRQLYKEKLWVLANLERELDTVYTWEEWRTLFKGYADLAEPGLHKNQRTKELTTRFLKQRS